MKYIKLFENFNEQDIHEICKKYGIENYTINDDGSIDIDDDVNLVNCGLTKLPLRFNNVTGNFNCSYNNLTSLEGCPVSVGGNFNCDNNKLTSLEYCPKSVGMYFNCSRNKLTSLEGCTKLITGDFTCFNNKLSSLEFMPKCLNFLFHNNKIRDFKGFIEPVSDIYCFNNPIHKIWNLFGNKEHIELLNEYDCIRGNNIVIDRLNMFLEEIDKDTVEFVYGYNNI